MAKKPSRLTKFAKQAKPAEILESAELDHIEYKVGRYLGSLDRGKERFEQPFLNALKGCVLNLSSRVMSEWDLIVVIRFLNDNPRIHTLVLQDCGLNNDSAFLLAAGLTTIHTLRVSNNRIRNLGTIALAGNIHFTNLDISKNRVEHSGVKALLKNKYLEFLDISHNKIDEKCIKALTRNQTLETLKYDKKTLEPKMKEKIHHDLSSSILLNQSALIELSMSDPIPAELTELLNLRVSFPVCISAFKLLKNTLNEAEMSIVLDYCGKNIDKVKARADGVEVKPITFAREMSSHRVLSLNEYIDTPRVERNWNYYTFEGKRQVNKKEEIKFRHDRKPNNHNRKDDKPKPNRVKKQWQLYKKNPLKATAFDYYNES